MGTTTLLRRGERIPVQRDTRPMTRLGTKTWRDTFRRPRVGDGETQRQMWGAVSLDGRWAYDRQDDGLGTLWTVTYRPSGQTREGYGTSYAARRDTRDRLVDELRAEAFVAALQGPIERRAEGQRWLAKHMRVLGCDEADARCVCGGLLVRATKAGAWGHVDGCDQCYRHGAGFPAGGCFLVAGHKFCAMPVPVECSHWLDRPRACGEMALPNRGAGCGLGKSGDCCTQCCNGE